MHTPIAIRNHNLFVQHTHAKCQFGKGYHTRTLFCLSQSRTITIALGKINIYVKQCKKIFVEIFMEMSRGSDLNTKICVFDKAVLCHFMPRWIRLLLISRKSFRRWGSLIAEVRDSNLKLRMDIERAPYRPQSTRNFQRR